MARQVGMFDVEGRLAGLSKKGDDLERLAAVVDFELFRRELERAVPRADRSKGGRPPFDHVLMFKVLILQTQNNLSDERTEFYLRDRLTWMRFLGLGLGDAMPDANTIWTLREALTRAGAIRSLFERFDRELRARGYLAMSGQLVDASIVAAPKQRNTRAEKQAIKEGRVPDAWQAKPAKLSQKDRDARWTVKTTKAKPRAGESPLVDLAIPEFGYQNHISADRRHRLIRRWLVTDAAAHAGTRLADLLDPGNTAAGVWADTGYRSIKNEYLLRQRMLVSHIRILGCSAGSIPPGRKPSRPGPSRSARSPTRALPPSSPTISTAPGRSSRAWRSSTIPTSAAPATSTDGDPPCSPIRLSTSTPSACTSWPRATRRSMPTPKRRHQTPRRPTPRRRRAQFFARRSFSAAISSIDSASSFFSRRFSSSRLFRRCASDGPSPPYRAFQR